jgi:hypothetical protein
MTIPFEPSDKESILSYLEPLWPDAWRAFETGTQHAAAYFKDQPVERARTRDPWLFPHLVRFQARTYLAERGVDANIDPIWLALSGVAVRFGCIDLRFLLSDGGRLPAPGKSWTKRAFYHQAIQNPLFILDDEQPREPSMVNIVVTWGYDSGGVLTGLTAYCPNGGGRGRDSATEHWHHALAHPATTYQPPAAPIEEGERTDLPIGHPEDQTPDERVRTG